MRIKKYILCAIAIISMIYGLTACVTGGENSKTFEYELSDDNTYYILTGIGNYTDLEITVPETYKDFPVKEIADSAFKECENITSVKLPDSITTIGSYAFAFCKNLKSINIPNAVTKLETSAFTNCDKLEKVTLGSGLITIGMNVFNYCYSLEEITFPNSLQRIEYGAFAYCKGLKNITIHENITHIGGMAFYDCKGLTNVIIPQTVITMETDVFEGCSNLKIYCEADSRPDGWSGSWNGGRPVTWGYTTERPNPDEESIRVKALLNDNFNNIKELHSDNYSLSYSVKSSENWQTSIEKKCGGDYYLYGLGSNSDGEATRNYYEKTEDNKYARYNIYDNTLENSSFELAYQFVMVEEKYFELRYDIANIFSEYATYREIDNKIVVEDKISRLTLGHTGYYSDPLANVKAYFDSGLITFTFEFTNDGFTASTKTSNENELIEIKFEKITEITDFNFEDLKEHGTEDEPEFLKQYLTIDEEYLIPKKTFSALEDRYFKIKLTPGYYVMRNINFEIQNNDFEAIDLPYESLLEKNSNANKPLTGFLVEEEIEGYLVVYSDNIRDTYLRLSFTLNKLERAPMVREAVDVILGETVEVTDMQEFDKAVFTIPCTPSTTYYFESTTFVIINKEKVSANSYFFTSSDSTSLTLTLKGQNATFKITQVYDDEYTNSKEEPLSLTTEFDKSYILLNENKEDYFTFNVLESGTYTIVFDDETKLYLGSNVYVQLYDSDDNFVSPKNNEITTYKLEPGTYLIKVSSSSSIIYREYNVKYEFVTNLYKTLVVDSSDEATLTHTLSAIHYADTVHEYTFTLTEGMKLNIIGNCYTYEMAKEGTDFIYRASEFYGKDSTLFLNAGTYKIKLYVTEEPKYDMSLLFSPRTIENDDFTPVVVQSGKTYTFDFTEREFYILRLDLKANYWYVFTGSVTVEYSSILYSGFDELPINDNVYRSFSGNYECIYLYVTKGEANQGTLKIVEKK